VTVQLIGQKSLQSCTGYTTSTAIYATPTSRVVLGDNPVPDFDVTDISASTESDDLTGPLVTDDERQFGRPDTGETTGHHLQIRATKSARAHLDEHFTWPRLGNRHFLD